MSSGSQNKPSPSNYFVAVFIINGGISIICLSFMYYSPLLSITEKIIRTEAADHCLCPGLYRKLFAGARMAISAFQRLFAFTKPDSGIIQNAFVAFVEHCLIEVSIFQKNKKSLTYHPMGGIIKTDKRSHHYGYENGGIHYA